MGDKKEEIAIFADFNRVQTYAADVVTFEDANGYVIMDFPNLSRHMIKMAVT